MATYERHVYEMVPVRSTSVRDAPMEMYAYEMAVYGMYTL